MLVKQKRVTMFLVPILLLLFSVDKNQWLARGCLGQSPLGPQALWSRHTAQAVWGVGCPPWLDVPLGQVLYQSCAFPGGIIWPVWNNRHGSIIMNCEQMTNCPCTVFKLSDSLWIVCDYFLWAHHPLLTSSLVLWCPGNINTTVSTWCMWSMSVQVHMFLWLVEMLVDESVPFL